MVNRLSTKISFTLLLNREVCGSNMFIANETCKLFNHNLLALEQRNYFMYGQRCSLAILQGSLAPPFLSPTLADYIVFRELSRAQSQIDDVFNFRDSCVCGSFYSEQIVW